jgi:hypothetical protein
MADSCFREAGFTLAVRPAQSCRTFEMRACMRASRRADLRRLWLPFFFRLCPPGKSLQSFQMGLKRFRAGQLFSAAERQRPRRFAFYSPIGFCYPVGGLSRAGSEEFVNKGVLSLYTYGPRDGSGCFFSWYPSDAWDSNVLLSGFR